MASLKVSIQEKGLVMAEKAKDKMHFGQVKTADVAFKEKDVEILF